MHYRPNIEIMARVDDHVVKLDEGRGLSIRMRSAWQNLRRSAEGKDCSIEQSSEEER